MHSHCCLDGHLSSLITSELMGNFKQKLEENTQMLYSYKCHEYCWLCKGEKWKKKKKKTFGVAEDGSARACHLLPSRNKTKGTQLIRVIEVEK